MAIGAFPLAKLGLVVIKQISKPISHPSNKDDKEEDICGDTTAPWLTRNVWFTAAKENRSITLGTHDHSSY